MRVGEFYASEVSSVQANASLTTAAKVMDEAGVGALPVYDGATLVGMLSERDMIRAVADEIELSSTPISQYMTDGPLVADINADSREVAHRMLRMGIRHLPVVDGPELVGMVSMRDLVAVDTWA